MRFVRVAPLCLIVLIALAGLSSSGARADEGGRKPAFPLAVGDGGRHLVDAEGRPFFYHADTAWALFKKLSLDEAREYLDDRTSRGFTAVHVHAVSKEVGPVANRAGAGPFDPPDDITRPHEPYWRHVDGVVALAAERGLLLSIAALWIRWGGDDREGWRGQLDEANAVVYGRFLGERYKRFDNVVWIVGGDADPKEKTAAVDALASAIKAAAPHHLITVHNAPGHASAQFFHDRPWLDVNFAYTYAEVPPHVLGEYRRGGTVRPIVLGESGYEGESNDRRGGDPFRMRRQAYGAVLCGALGGHAFGQKHVWRFDDEWRAALDSPATRHMAHAGRLFAGLPWHDLVPDAGHALVTAGFGTPGETDYAPAAVTRDGTLALVYLPAPRRVTVDLSRLAGPASAQWFDPTDGSYAPAAGARAPNAGTRDFEPPARNAGGDDDFVLVLRVAAP